MSRRNLCHGMCAQGIPLQRMDPFIFDACGSAPLCGVTDQVTPINNAKRSNYLNTGCLVLRPNRTYHTFLLREAAQDAARPRARYCTWRPCPARGSNPCRNSLLSMSTIKTDFARIGSHRRLCPPNVQMPSRASFTSVASRGKSCRAGSTCRLGCSSGGGSSSCSNRPGRTSATFSYTRRCVSERTRGDEAHKQAPLLPPC